MTQQRSCDERYLRLGLCYNPFPDTGAEAFKTRLDELITASLPSNKRVYQNLEGLAKQIEVRSTAFVVYGGWGYGKTHALLYVARKLKEYYAGRNLLVVYIEPTPLRSEGEFYGEVATRLNEAVEELGESGLEHFNECDQLGCLINGLKELRNRGYLIYLALDQFERDVEPLLSSGRSDEVARIAQMVETFARTLSSELGTGILIGIGSYYSVWLELERHMAAGYFVAFELRPLIISDIEEIIKNYINAANLNKNELLEMGLSHREVEYIEAMRLKNNLYPFERSAVDALYQICREGGSCTPRTVCTYARLALERAASSEYGDVQVVTRAHVYASARSEYVVWDKELQAWLQKPNWRGIVSAIRTILSKASELELIDLLPENVLEEHAHLVGARKGYQLRSTEFLVGLRGEKLVVVSPKYSSRVNYKDIIEYLQRAIYLKDEVGFQIGKLILITLTDLDPKARQWLSVARQKNIVVDPVKIEVSPGELGRILYAANMIREGKIWELEQAVRKSVKEELREILNRILRVISE
jgi:Cdc6-like AAA superfamily ATPase